jgi:hypothetical protein
LSESRGSQTARRIVPREEAKKQSGKGIYDFVQFVATNGLAAHQVPVWLPYTKIVISSILALYGLYLLRGEWLNRLEKRPDSVSLDHSQI